MRYLYHYLIMMNCIYLYFKISLNEMGLRSNECLNINVKILKTLIMMRLRQLLGSIDELQRCARLTTETPKARQI